MVEVARRKKESAKRTFKYNSISMPNLKKRPLVAVLKKDGGAKDSYLKKGSYRSKTKA